MVPPVGVECVLTYGPSLENDSTVKGERRAKREKREKTLGLLAS
jgi:hypothetical protein